MEGTETYTYDIYYNPFRIEQRVDGILTQVLNPIATLYVEESVSENMYD